MSEALPLAIGQSASSTKCLAVDERSRVVARAQSPVSVSTPQSGWDAEEIWTSVRQTTAAVLERSTARWIASIGLSTQRESCVAWDRHSAMGAEHLAGISSGVFTWDGLKQFNCEAERFVPAASPVIRRGERRAWLRAVAWIASERQ